MFGQQQLEQMLHWFLLLLSTIYISSFNGAAALLSATGCECSSVCGKSSNTPFDWCEVSEEECASGVGCMCFPPVIWGGRGWDFCTPDSTATTIVEVCDTPLPRITTEEFRCHKSFACLGLSNNPITQQVVANINRVGVELTDAAAVGLGVCELFSEETILPGCCTLLPPKSAGGPQTNISPSQPYVEKAYTYLQTSAGRLCRRCKQAGYEVRSSCSAGSLMSSDKPRTGKCRDAIRCLLSSSVEDSELLPTRQQDIMSALATAGCPVKLPPRSSSVQAWSLQCMKDHGACELFADLSTGLMACCNIEESAADVGWRPDNSVEVAGLSVTASALCRYCMGTTPSPTETIRPTTPRPVDVDIKVPVSPAIPVARPGGKHPTGTGNMEPPEWPSSSDKKTVGGFPVAGGEGEEEHGDEGTETTIIISVVTVVSFVLLLAGCLIWYRLRHVARGSAAQTACTAVVVQNDQTL